MVEGALERREKKISTTIFFAQLVCVEERERRSTVITADGERESSIIRSQGTRAKIVLDAEADKTATVQRAKGISNNTT